MFSPRYRSLRSLVELNRLRHLTTGGPRLATQATAESSPVRRGPQGKDSSSGPERTKKKLVFSPYRRPPTKIEFREKLVSTGNVLQIPTITGPVAVPGRWLRDNCSCAQCRNSETKQRQINVLKGNINCDIASISVTDAASVKITFGDGHESSFPNSFIRGRGGWDRHETRLGIVEEKRWDATIASQPPTVRFESLQSDGLGPLLHQIRKFGFCFVEGTPATPEATESLLAAIGPIRNTHYGAFYDFTADLSSKDTAYTSEALEPHTDNTYFTEPAGLQALHLLSHTDGAGGESSLVDGFAIAEKLYASGGPAYRTLSVVKIHAHASGNNGISIQSHQAMPTLSHDPITGQICQVRWNNADRGGIASIMSHMDKWYDAASQFDALISDPKNQYWFQLTPGRVLIFDNWRVLHGRAAFTGKRRMCGGYIPRDDFISRYRMTNMSPEKIEASTVTG